MKKILFWAIALLVAAVSAAQNTVTLPYTADFSQGWTTTGGASIINSQWAELNGTGQTLTSPWIEVGSDGELYFLINLWRDTTAGRNEWQQLADTVVYSVRIRTADGILYDWVNQEFAYYNSYGLSYLRGSDYAGQTIQVVFSYEGGTAPLYPRMEMYQYAMELSVEASSTAHIGDTVIFQSHLHLPENDSANYRHWYLYDSQWNYYDIYESSADNSVVSVVSRNDSCLVLVWHTTGNFNIEAYASTTYLDQYSPYMYANHIISILDTVTVDCDSIFLPYTADFTQCWTVENGATVIDATHAAITSAGQKITGPWMESAPGKIFFHFALPQGNDGIWNENMGILLTIENENGTIASWQENPSGGWGSFLLYFDSPGGRIRLVAEYIGSQPLPSFTLGDVVFHNYQIENRLEGPSIAQVGDTLTFTAHATLQDGDVPDIFSWGMYNPNGNWMSDYDPARTIVSRSDSTLVVVWNNPGRYQVVSDVYKYGVYQSSYAYAGDWMYINIVDHSFYEEDSIYYTSAAKDTVIGSHPGLHVATLPESVTVIADSAFFSHATLASVSLPHSLTHIGKCAFARTHGFNEITIPENVVFVGDNAFWYCLGLNTVNFNATNCQTMSPSTADDGSFWPVFIRSNNIHTINIGENVTRIPDRAFSYCEGLRGTLTIPDAVTYIGIDAFFQWGAANGYHLVLGSGVQEIGVGAFVSSPGHIGSITSRSTVPPTIADGYAFSDNSPVLTVPCGSVDAYRAAPGWANFSYIRDTCGNGLDMPVLNVNNISTTVYPLGYLAYDGSQTNFFVNGTNRSTLFANGLWIGSGEHTAIRQFGTSGDDFQVGPLTDDGQPLGDDRYNRVWAVSREMIDYHLAHYGEPGYEPAESIRTWPAEDDNVGHEMAPYYDANHDGHYNPLDGDYPLIRGDRAMFSIFNDAGTHGESGGQALGVEVHCMTYAFREPQDNALWNTVFVHYDIFNRSSNTYEDTYIGMWSDFDIGYAYDDYVGCDVAMGMYYAYNGQESDVPGAGSFYGYGVPPAQGCVILAGPWQQADGLDNASINSDSWHFFPGNTMNNQAINGFGFGNGIVDDERMGMTNFTYYENSYNSINGAPTEAIHYYNYLHSLWMNGQHVRYGGNGATVSVSDIDCSFMFPGNSDPWHWGTDGIDPDIYPNGWDEASAFNAPGDRRGLGSCGPFTFQSSSTATTCHQLDVAYVTAWGQTGVNQSVESLRTYAFSIRQQFSSCTTSSGRPFIYQPLVTGIESPDNKPALQAYPNPTTGTLTISLSDEEPCEVELYDMMGRKILSQRISGSATFELYDLPRGVYMLRTANGAKRIIKR